MLTHFVSVIIPVYNDSERLMLCLKALEKQTYSQDLYEVIVVDNDSTEDIKSIVCQFSQAKYTYEKQPGSYVARNQGITIAKGDIIAFTDSDCIPASYWIEKGVTSLFSMSNCGLVAGKIDLFFKNPEKPTAVELYENIMMNFHQQENVEKNHFGVTANIFTFKSVINDVGKFNYQLKSGGDVEWGNRVFNAGYKQLYAEDVYIQHPARDSFDQLRNRIIRITGGKFDRMMNQSPSLSVMTKDLLGTFKPPFRSIYRAFTNRKLDGAYQKLQFIVVMFFARYIVISEKIRLYRGESSQR